MALREEFEVSGGTLFRWRSYIPLIFLGLVVFAMSENTASSYEETIAFSWGLISIAISYFGLCVRISTIGYTPANTSSRSTNEQVAEVLNTSGAYSIVRNPLYVGNFFMGFGVVFFVQHWWLLIIYVLIFWLYYERIIFAEEEFLRKKFKSEFISWSSVTPAFIPDLVRYRKADIGFSLKTVIRREHNAFFSVVVVMFLLESFDKFIFFGVVWFDSRWLVVLGVCFLTWIVIRLTKMFSTFLIVDGR